MKILFISMVPFEYNTSATIQNKGIVLGLSQLGCSVDTMTLQPQKDNINYDISMNDISSIINNSIYIPIDESYRKLMAKKRSLVKSENKIRRLLSVTMKKFRKVIKFFYNNISIYDPQKINVKGVSKVSLDYSKYDVVISASDPKSSHLIAKEVFSINKSLKAKWIQYWGDPWYNDITRNKSWKNIFFKIFEQRIISAAVSIIYASPLTLELQKKSFPNEASKMNYVNQSFINILHQKPEYQKKAKGNDMISLGYYGSYKSVIRNIMPLYNTAVRNNLELNICGPSDIKLKSVKRVSVRGNLPYRETVLLENNTDILVCLCNNKGTQIPGKIYYCSNYEKPIIVILDGEHKQELSEYLQSFERFILCENNEEAILNAVNEAVEKLNLNDYNISEKLTPEHIAKRILNTIKY